MICNKLYRVLFLYVVFFSALSSFCKAQESNLVVDDFEKESSWYAWADKKSQKPEFKQVKSDIQGEFCGEFYFPNSIATTLLRRKINNTSIENPVLRFWVKNLSPSKDSCYITLQEGDDIFRTTFPVTPDWVQISIPLSDFLYAFTKGEQSSDKRLDPAKISSMSFTLYSHPSALRFQADMIEIVPSNPSISVDKTGNLLNFDTDFETGTGPFTYYSSPNREFPLLDSKNPFHGRYSLRIPAQHRSWVRSAKMRLESDTNYTLSFYAKASIDDTPLWCNVFANRWENCGGNTIRIDKEWKRYSVPLKCKTGGFAFIGLSQKNKADIWLDCVQLEEGVLSEYKPNPRLPVVTNLTTGEVGEVVMVNKPGVDLTLSIINNTVDAIEMPLKIFVTVKNFPKRTIMQKELGLTVSRDTCLEKKIFENINIEIGYYTAQVVVRDHSGKLLDNSLSPFAVIKEPAKEVGTLIFGLNMAADVPYSVLRKIGVRSVRIMPAISVLGWKNIEPKKDEFSFAKDVIAPECFQELSVFTPARAEGGTAPAWSINPASKLPYAKDYAKYFAKIAQMTREYPVIFEVINEPHLSIYSHAKRSLKEATTIYSNYLKQIAAEKSGVAVAACGVGLDDKSFDFAREVFKNAAHDFSIMPIHPYSDARYLGPKSIYYGNPEILNLPQKYNQYQQIMKEHNAPKEFWLGEFGYAVDYECNYDSPENTELAALMSRTMIISAATGFVSRMYWFVSCDGGVGGEAGRYSYAMWLATNGYKPRSMVAAYSAIAGWLHDIKGNAQVLAESDIRAYLFEKNNGQRLLAMWDWKNRGTEISLDLPTDDISAFDVVGAPIKLNNSNTLPLTSLPVFVASEKLSAMQIKNAFEKAMKLQRPLNFNYRIINANSLRVFCTNLTGDIFEDSLKVSLKDEDGKIMAIEQRIACPAGQTQAIDYNFPHFIPAKGTQINYSLSTTANGKPFLFKENIPPILVCARVGADAKPEMVELGAESVTPPDPIVGWEGLNDLSVSAWVQWDDNDFIFHAKIIDDIHDQKHKGNELWRGDSIQLAFDMGNDASSDATGYNHNDYEYGVALSESGEVLSSCWQAPPGTSKSTLASSMKIKAKRFGLITTYTVRIPWASLAPFNINESSVFGFSFIVNDNDNNLIRNYCMAMTQGINSVKAPGLFRKVVLRK